MLGTPVEYLKSSLHAPDIAPEPWLSTTQGSKMKYRGIRSSSKERDPRLERCYQLDSEKNIQGSSMAYCGHILWRTACCAAINATTQISSACSLGVWGFSLPHFAPHGSFWRLESIFSLPSTLSHDSAVVMCTVFDRVYVKRPSFTQVQWTATAGLRAHRALTFCHGSARTLKLLIHLFTDHTHLLGHWVNI